jgi:outer membrane receptor for ferrienterochelin and colicins
MRGGTRAVGSHIVIGILLAARGVVFAQRPPAPIPPAAVDPADLPPLPPADEELSSSATVLAAAAAEEDIVVGAAKREQSLGNVASAVTVVSADRIRRFGYRTVGEAVAAVAGLYLEDNRINASLGIRGLLIPGDFNTRILVLVDGATVNEAWGASSGLGFENVVSIDEIARIEVIRGPVSSVYGANAFFGIINIVTRGAAESSRAWGRFTIGPIGGVIGTAGFAAGGVDQQIRGSVLAMNRFGESLYLPDVGSGLSGDGANALLASVVGTYGRTFAQVRAFHARRDSPFAPYNGDPDVSTPYKQLNSQLLVEGGHTRDLSKRVTVAARGYVNVYRFFDDIKEYTIDETTGERLPADTFLDYGDSATVGGELRGRFEALDDGKLGVTAGVETNYNRTKSRLFYEGREDEGVGEDGAGIPFNFAIAGLYSEVDTAPTEWLGAMAGVRFDYNSRVDRRLSPRAALFVSKRDKYGLKLLYAEGFRNPSAFEYAFEDQTTFIAAQNLRAERIRSFEAVAWAKPVAGLSTRLSGFHWDARDVIVNVPVMVAGFPDPLLQFQNIGQFITQGVEAEASYRTASGWYGFAGGALARVGSTEDPAMPVSYGSVPDAPQLTAAGGISTPRLLGVAHLSSELTVIGRRPTRPQLDDSDSPDSPTWFGLNVIAFAPNVHGFDITLAVRNLRNKRDLLPAPGDYDRTRPREVVVPRIPGEAREVYLKVGYAY